MRSAGIRATRQLKLSHYRDKNHVDYAFPPDSIQAKLLELRGQLPRRAWSKVPRDGAFNMDHYLYGSSRKT